MPRGEQVGIKLEHICGIAAPHQAVSGGRCLAIVQGFAADAVRGAVVARAGSVGIHGDRLCHEATNVFHGAPHIAAWLRHCKPGGSCQNQSHTIGSATMIRNAHQMILNTTINRIWSEVNAASLMVQTMSFQPSASSSRQVSW